MSKSVAKKQTTVQKEGGEKGGLFDLEDQFAFYGQYVRDLALVCTCKAPETVQHVNPVNVAIHIVCVPWLFWSGMTLSGLYSSSPSLGHVNIGGVDLNLNFNFLYGVGHALYFIMLEPLAGLLYAPIILTFAWSSNWLPQHYPKETLPIALAVWFGGWAAQIYGHQAHEGRAPALLQNLFQSVVLAVFFVWMELLFKLGYRPELHKRLSNRINREVVAYRKEKAAAQRAKAK